MVLQYSETDVAQIPLPGDRRQRATLTVSDLHVPFFSDHFPQSIFLCVPTLALINTAPWDPSPFRPSYFAGAKVPGLSGLIKIFCAFCPRSLFRHIHGGTKIGTHLGTRK